MGERSSPKICEDPRFDTLGVAPPARGRTRWTTGDYLSDQQRRYTTREEREISLLLLFYTHSPSLPPLSLSLFSRMNSFAPRIDKNRTIALSPLTLLPPFFPLFLPFFPFFSFIAVERNRITYVIRKDGKIGGRSSRHVVSVYTRRARSYTKLTSPLNSKSREDYTASAVVVTPRSRGVKLASEQRCIDFGLWMLREYYFAMDGAVS